MYEPPDPKPEDELDDAPEAGDDEAAGDEDALDGDDGDGEEDVSAGDDAESEGGEAEAGEDVEPARKKRTANDVVREAKRARTEADSKAAEALRRAEAAERRAEAAERSASERRRAETEAEEAARLELMSPDEKVQHYRQKDRDEHQREMQGVKFQIWDSTDRSEFRQMTRDDPLVAKVKDKVEAEFARLNAMGRPVSRQVLADLEIGKMAREGRLKATERQRARGDASVRRETVKPPRTRSDVAPQRARRGEENPQEARRKRLEDVQL